MKDREQLSSEGIYISQKLISVHELFGGSVPKQHHYESREMQDFYNQLAAQPLYPHFKTFGETTDFLIACPPLRGKELQQVFHFAAPSKAHGVDYNDTQEDWEKLYTDKSREGKNRLKAHQQMPGWGEFEKHRVALREFIKRDVKGKAPENERVIPIIHVTQENSTIRWDFESVDREQKSVLSQHAGNFPANALHYLPALGPLFIAAYSPAMTQSWGQRLDYTLGKILFGGQDMGSTQVFALSLALSHTLIDTQAFQSLITYAKTGEAPEMIPSQEAQVEERLPTLIQKFLKFSK